MLNPLRAKLALLALLFLVVPCKANAVVGGTGVSSINQFPFQVELWNQLGGDPVNGFFCGGVVLDATHIATAAHCVLDTTTGQATPPSNIHVLAGTADLDNTTGASDPVAVADSFDPRYDTATNDYDMGVITLGAPLDLTGSTIKSIAPVVVQTIQQALRQTARP